MEPSTLTIIILILAVISFLLEKIPVNMTVMLTLWVNSNLRIPFVIQESLFVI